MRSDIKRYFLSKGWQFKPRGDTQYRVKVCPFCGDTRSKFDINGEQGLWRCWACNEHGNLYKLKHRLGDVEQVRDSKDVSTAGTSLSSDPLKKGQSGKPISMGIVKKAHKRLLKNKSVRAYCRKRGLSMEVVKKYKLGLRRTRTRAEGEINWLCIPHINNDTCYNVKRRSLPPSEKLFRREKGASSVLYNQDALEEHDEIILVEGEIDALTLIQRGYSNVIAVTSGCDNFFVEWYDLLCNCTKITLIYDSDVVGQQGAREVAGRLGVEKCYNVKIPSKDINDFFVEDGHTKAEFDAYLQQAKRFDIEDVASLSTTLGLVWTESLIGNEGFFTPWENVNRLMPSGHQPGDLWILSAPPKTGKTTFALSCGYFLAAMGVPSLVMCLEMRRARLAKKCAAQLRQQDIDDLTTEDLVVAQYQTSNLPFYFQKRPSPLSRKAVFKRLRDAVRRFGIKFLVFDNLQFLCRSITNVSQEVGVVTREFKGFAEDMEIVVCLIAQPRKTGGRIMTMEDLKDSASIGADADAITILHRNVLPINDGESKILDPRTLVRWEADRYGEGGDAWLYYEGALSTFRPMDQKLISAMHQERKSRRRRGERGSDHRGPLAG